VHRWCREDAGNRPINVNVSSNSWTGSERPFPIGYRTRHLADRGLEHDVGYRLRHLADRGLEHDVGYRIRRLAYRGAQHDVGRRT